MTDWNVSLEFQEKDISDDRVDVIASKLRNHHAAIAVASADYLGVRFTVEAEGPLTALENAHKLLEPLDLPVRRALKVEIQTQEALERELELPTARSEA
jgi:hypothetical protein